MKAVYDFSEASGSNKKLLGGKGAGLSEMTRLKLPVPPGFVITTEVCKAYYANGKKLHREVLAQVNRNIAKMEKKTGKGWNDPDNPLLVSVRSGAAISMPGMMDTILNLGLNDSTVNGLAAKSSNPRFAWDSYRRFVQLFGKVVFGIDDSLFETVLDNAKNSQGVKMDGDLNEASLRSVVSEYKKICKNHTGKEFPSNLLYESHANLGLLLLAASPFTVESFNPRLSIVSIMPGIDIAAPERTDTRSGLSGSFHPLPVFFSIFAMLRFTCARTSRCSFLPFA